MVCMVVALIAAGWGIGVMSSGKPDPREVVAQALGVKQDSVRIHRTGEMDGGREAFVEATVTDGHEERVRVKYDAETGSLGLIFWLDRSVYEPKDKTISMDEARGAAERLMSRLFPAVPVEMQLTESKKRDQPPKYSFAWQALVAPGVYTGDHVLVGISSITARPISYLQRVAKVRPKLEDIKIAREGAVAIARKHLTRLYEPPVELSLHEARLILSSVIHPDEGPVWIVDFDVKAAHGAQTLEIERASSVIDAMSGAVLE